MKPYILYAFISPSNNVKFAVLTDFVCDDKADISQKYQIGYRLISDDPKFQDMLSGYELDGSADRVSQACYISDDPAAYFNQDCKPLDNLNGMITDKFDDLAGEAVALQIEIDKDNKNKKDLYTNTDEDVLECLESFTSNPVKYQGKFYVWDYNNRSKINFAVINHFGPDAENILVAHWLRIGIDTDEPKLRQQIQDHIESDAYKKHSGENTIKVATLFWWAEKLYDHVQQSLRISRETNQKATFHHKGEFLDVKDVGPRLQKIIGNFFENKINTMINIEAGAGKTRTMMEMSLERHKENPKDRIAIFCKTHEAITELIADFHAKGFFNVQHMWGISHFCAPPSDKGIIEGDTFCGSCLTFHDKSDGYHIQYEDHTAPIRIYTHNRLFQEPKVDKGGKKGWRPDYLIVDECIVAMVTDDKETMLILEETSKGIFISLKDVLKDLQMDTPIRQALKNHLQGLKQDQANIKYKIEQQDRARSNHENLSLEDGMKIKDGYTTNRRLKLYAGMIAELISLAQNGDEKADCTHNVWTRKTEKFDKLGNPIAPIHYLVYSKPQKIISDYDGIAMIYMDASGNQEIIEKALPNRDFKFHHIKVKYQSNVKVYQMTNNAPFSKSTMKVAIRDDKDKIVEYDYDKRIDQFIAWLSTFKVGTGGISLVRNKQIDGDDERMKRIDDEILKLNGLEGIPEQELKDSGRWPIATFANLRGVNRLKDYQIQIVLGQHILPPPVIHDKARSLFGKESFVGKSYSQNVQNQITDKVYRMKSPGKNMVTRQYEYENEALRLTALQSNESERYQAVMRSRPIHGEQEKEIYIVSDPVGDNTITELLDKSKEFNPDNIKMISYIMANDYIRDKPTPFKIVLGCSVSKCNTFRTKDTKSDRRGSLRWMFNHRHLNHWSYTGKGKVKGKLLATKQMTAEQLKDRLQKDHNIKITNIHLTTEEEFSND